MPSTRASSRSTSSRSKSQATPSTSSASSSFGGVQLTPSASDIDTLSFTSEDLVPTPTGSTTGTRTPARSVITIASDDRSCDGEDDTASITSRRSVFSGYSVATNSSSASTDTLTSIFKKLSVDDKRKALDALQNGTTTQPAIDHHGDITGLHLAPALEDWQALCRVCGIVDGDMPQSITLCKNVCTTYSVCNLCMPTFR